MELLSEEALDRSQMNMIYGGSCGYTLTCDDGTKITGTGSCPTYDDAKKACENHGGAD